MIAALGKQPKKRRRKPKKKDNPPADKWIQLTSP
jgi:hypothetical protein